MRIVADIHERLLSRNLVFWNPPTDGRVSVFSWTVRRIEAHCAAGNNLPLLRILMPMQSSEHPHTRGPKQITQTTRSACDSGFFHPPKLPWLVSTCSFAWMQMRDSTAGRRYSRLIYEAAWTAVSPNLFKCVDVCCCLLCNRLQRDSGQVIWI